jgi:hypothetical protein
VPRLGGGPGRPKDNSATLAELAQDLDIPRRTLEWRVEAARLPEPLREAVRVVKAVVLTSETFSGSCVDDSNYGQN